MVFRLPVDDDVGAAALEGQQERAVLGSRWMPVPMRSPLNGWVRSNSAAVWPNRRQLSLTHSNRDTQAPPAWTVARRRGATDRAGSIAHGPICGRYTAPMETIYYGGAIILGLVIWFVLTYYAIKMARNRGRSPVGWGIAAFLTFGIAIFVLAVLPSKKGTSGHHLQ